MNSPNLGVVGCGYWGKNLVRNFFDLGALAAICDVENNRLEKLRRDYRVAATTSVDEMLAMPNVAAVAIAAPAAEHYSLAKKALLAGKDVFVEKPLALRLNDGEELVALAKSRNRVLMVGHLLHYHPAVVELKRLIQSGELGRVEYVSSSRLNLGKLRTEEDILWSFAPHDISTIVYLLNEMPAQVAAQGASYLNHEISDVTLSILNFTSGVKAHIFVSWLHPYKEQKLIIVGDRKMAVFDDMESDRKLVLYPHRIEWVDRLPVAHPAEGEILTLAKEEPLRNECLHFLECVNNKRTPNTDGENGLRVLRILHACSQSIKENGQPQRLFRKAKPFFAHSSAVIDEPCEIGEGTKIWHFSHVMENARIGHKCILGQNVNVAPGVRIGNNVKIQNNVSLYTGVELEDDVFCGPSMVFTNVITPRSHVNRKSEYKPTLVKTGASLGANCTIVCGTTIGRFAFVGAGAVVTRDVPDHALVVGVPARQVGWVCKCGVTVTMSSAVGICSSCGNNYALENGKLVQIAPTNEQTLELRSFSAAAGQD